MHIILKNVLMLFTKNIKISPCFSKLRLAKVGEFFRHNILTVLMFFCILYSNICLYYEYFYKILSKHVL